MKACHIMRKEFVTIHENATFSDVLKVMVENKTNSVVVVDKKENLVGVIDSYRLIKQVVPDFLLGDDVIASLFSDEDVFKEACLKARDKKISDFIKKDVIPVDEDDNIMEVAVKILGQGQQRIPVVKAGKPIGLITRTELKRLIAHYLGIEHLKLPKDTK